MPKRILAATVVLSGLLFLVAIHLPARADPNLPNRAFIAFLAADGQPTPAPLVPPPPGPGYCQPAGDGPPTPPNAVIGTLTLGGQPAPAATLVTLTFDGQPGPSAYTEATGGYRVFYAAGGQGFTPRCINEVGSEIGLLVNGESAESGSHVGDVETRLLFLFDVSLP